MASKKKAEKPPRRSGNKTEDRKLHVELSPANHSRLVAHLDAYNHDPRRVTPPLKVKDVVNLALDRYLSNVSPSLDPEEER